MPDDSKIYIPRTVGKDQVVDDLILKFTHSREIDYRIPGIAPTGKYVELPHVVVMKFVGNKIAHKGIEQSRKLQELVTGSSRQQILHC
ncbi:MAG: hypothetical protein ACJ71H_20775 [Nitrososphaeraceae archaeon]